MRKPRMTYLIGLIVFSLAVCMPIQTMAAEAEFKLKIMGVHRSLDIFKSWERWAKTVEEKTQGKVQFELTTLPELGIGGKETIRLIDELDGSQLADSSMMPEDIPGFACRDSPSFGSGTTRS